MLIKREQTDHLRMYDKRILYSLTPFQNQLLTPISNQN
jgi:hypothetical protein